MLTVYANCLELSVLLIALCSINEWDTAYGSISTAVIVLALNEIAVHNAAYSWPSKQSVSAFVICVAFCAEGKLYSFWKVM